MNLQEFYLGLKSFDTVPLYIRGYTEVLSMAKTNIRVVTESDLEFVPSYFKRYFFNYNELLKMYLEPRIKPPFYFIPDSDGKNVYGFILKGQEKTTVHFSTWLSIFNMESLNSPKNYIIGVEGIKDCYPFMVVGYPTIAVLGSRPTKKLLLYIKSLGKKLIYICDNDEDKKINTGQVMREDLCKEMGKLKMCFALPVLDCAGDTGEYFDSDAKKAVIEKFVKRVESYI